jgi:hypothetical protein
MSDLKAKGVIVNQPDTAPFRAVVGPMTDRPRPGVEGRIARFATGLGLLALLVMVTSTLLAVLARYFQATGLEWSYEVAGLASIWLSRRSGDTLASLRTPLARLASIRLKRMACSKIASGVCEPASLKLQIGHPTVEARTNRRAFEIEGCLLRQ